MPKRPNSKPVSNPHAYTPAQVDSINASGHEKAQQLYRDQLMKEHRRKLVKAVGGEKEYQRRLV